MIGMVLGRDGDHRAAMHERVRKDFHHEFTTMRFVPIGEFGTWDGRAGYV